MGKRRTTPPAMSISSIPPLWGLSYSLEIKDLSTRNSGCTVRVHCQLGLLHATKYKSTIEKLNDTVAEKCKLD
jgi:hypothetical protein